MTLQKSDARDAAQAQRQAAEAIEKRAGPARELYDYNRSLVEAFWPEISEFHAAWRAVWYKLGRLESRLNCHLALDQREEKRQ